MRVSRTRFSKRRQKRKTEFPIVAVIQKKRKPEYSTSNRFTLLARKNNRELTTTETSYHDRKDLKQKGFEESAENDNRKELKSRRSEERHPVRVQKKSRASIDYKNVILLRNLITAEGKILPRRINKLTAKQQRSVQKAIKSSRIMGLLPFINKSRPFSTEGRSVR